MVVEVNEEGGGESSQQSEIPFFSVAGWLPSSPDPRHGIKSHGYIGKCSECGTAAVVVSLTWEFPVN